MCAGFVNKHRKLRKSRRKRAQLPVDCFSLKLLLVLVRLDLSAQINVQKRLEEPSRSGVGLRR